MLSRKHSPTNSNTTTYAARKSIPINSFPNASMSLGNLSFRDRKSSDRSHDQADLQDTYLLCVDPETMVPFRINMGTHQVQAIGEKEKVNIQSKVKRQSYIMQELLVIDEYEKNFKWQMTENQYVSGFRRQMVPFYLLEHEASNFPRYVDYSDLSKNLCTEYLMNIQLILCPEIIQDLLKLKSDKHLKHDTTKIDELKQIQELKSISLLLTATKLIKIATKKMIELIPIELRNDINFKDKIRILKFKNYESYLYGDDQLIYFQEIRDLLRQNKEIELVLQIVDDNDQSQHFPPLFNFKYEKAQKELQILTKYTSNNTGSEFEASINKKSSFNRNSFIKRDTNKFRRLTAQKDELDFLSRLTEQNLLTQKYELSSIFFWYPPKKVTNNILSNLSSQGLKQSLGSQQICEYEYTESSKQQKYHNKGENHMFQQSDEQNNNEYIRFNQNLNKKIYSGNVNEAFSMKIISLNNLSLKLDDFIDVKDQAQEIEKIVYYDSNESDQQQKISTNDDDISIFLKKCENQQQSNKKNNEENKQKKIQRRDSRFNNHANNYYALQRLSQAVYIKKNESEKKAKGTFKFMPSQVQVQAALYLGSQRISEYSYSTPISFNTSITVNEIIQFYKTDHVIDDSLLYSLKKMKKKNQEINRINLLNSNKRRLLLVKDLPSNVRVGLNIIVLPEPNRLKLSKVKLPWRKGYIFGSVSFPIFDEDKFMQQSHKKLYMWPFEKFNPRMVCKGECFLYESEYDLKYPYLSKMNAHIRLPKFAKPVFWTLQEFDFTQAFKDQAQQEQPYIQQHFPELEQIRPKSMNKEDKELNFETKKLQDLKKMIDEYPLETRQKDYNAKLMFQYRNYIDIVPAFIKAVDFTNHEEIAICYDYIANSEQAKNMQPQEALALLDSQFGDSRVRLFAVKKLSHLNDSFISLYMPQLVQALKYELYHRSPLSEFLLERALNNTRVIGHALFWSLKANLSSIQSHERFYLILERFLLCCGKFKNQLYQQNETNRSLIHVWQRVRDYKKGQGKDLEKKLVEGKLHGYLKEKEIEMKLKFSMILSHSKFDDTQLSAEEIGEYYQYEKSDYQKFNSTNEQSYQFNIVEITNLIDKVKPELMKYYGDPVKSPILKKKVSYNDPLQKLKVNHQGKPVFYYKEQFFFPFEPKKPFKYFHDKSGIFLSKQMPLKLVVELQDQVGSEEDESNDFQSRGSEQMQIMFKYGDDLRQDGLVLQFFKLMDKLWLQNDFDLEMIAYNVMETGYRVGYIELVKNSVEISAIHKEKGAISGPFDKASIFDYFKKNILSTPTQKKDVSLEQVPQFHNTFIKSLAGQCVATYVLGIKDRHTGNFMLQKHTGKFFHIDFGHILGHAKHKFGIKRDRERFIYSSELDYFLTHLHELYPNEELYNKLGSSQKGMIKPEKKKVPAGCLPIKPNKSASQYLVPINSEEIAIQRFKYFEDLCCRAFKIIRENDHIFINLMMLMLVGGIKQLNEETIRYLIDSMLLNKSDEEASSDFKKFIQESLNTSFRKYDNVFHNFNDWRKNRKQKKTGTVKDDEMERSQSMSPSQINKELQYQPMIVQPSQ